MENNIPLHLITDATARGLMPGVLIRSAWPTENTKQAVIPPYDEWIWDDDENLYFRRDKVSHWIYDGESGRWATILQNEKGLQEGDCVPCGPAMRLAILELAKELHIPIYSNISKEKLAWVQGMLQGWPMAPTNLTPEEFIRRMRVTAKQQPLKIADFPVEYHKGYITFNNIVVPNDVMRTIVKNLKD